jgi:hypothetical protein
MNHEVRKGTENGDVAGGIEGGLPRLGALAAAFNCLQLSGICNVIGDGWAK